MANINKQTKNFNTVLFNWLKATITAFNTTVKKFLREVDFEIDIFVFFRLWFFSIRDGFLLCRELKISHFRNFCDLQQVACNLHTTSKLSRTSPNGHLFPKNPESMQFSRCCIVENISVRVYLSVYLQQCFARIFFL